MIDLGIVMGSDGVSQDESFAAPCTNILNNIILSIMVRKGSWFQNPSFGSRLYLLERSKSTPFTEARAQDYIKEALKWLVDAGRIAKPSDITVVTERAWIAGTARLGYRVDAIQANGLVVTFSNFVEVV